MSKRTVITFSGKPSKQKLEAPHCPPDFNHELSIDLGQLVHQERPKGYRRAIRHQQFLIELRKIVVENPDIDVITMECTDNGPHESVWKALEGLGPKHLEIRTGFDEFCDLTPLDMMSPPWSLRSLYLAGYSEEGLQQDGDNDVPRYVSPASLTSLESLHLHYCFHLPFCPKGGSRLKSLTIIENDATDMFMVATNHCPELPLSLLSLTIVSTTGNDFERGYEEWEFGDRIKKCTALKSLEVTILPESWYGFGPGGQGDDSDDTQSQIAKKNLGSYSNLPAHLSPSLTHLSFRGPSTEDMLHEMDIWIKHAKDPAWLPNLETIAFDADLRTKRRGFNFQDEINAQKADLLEILRARTPPVTVVERRSMVDGRHRA